MPHTLKIVKPARTTLAHLIGGSVEQCEEHVARADRETLIAARRHCDRNLKNNKTRRNVIDRALRKLINH